MRYPPQSLKAETARRGLPICDFVLEIGGQTGRFLIFIGAAHNDRSLGSGELPVCPHLSHKVDEHEC